MKNRILLGFVAIVLVIGLVIGGCAKPAPTPTPSPSPSPTPTPTPTPTPAPTPTPPAPGEEVFEWTAITTEGRASQEFPDMYVLLDGLEAATGGRIKVTIFEPGEHPYSQFETLKIMKERLCDIIGPNFPFSLVSQEPVIGALDLPYLFTGGVKEALEILPNIRGPLLDDPLRERWNSSPIGVYSSGYGTGIMMTDPFKMDSFTSLKGFQVRVASATLAMLIELLGGVPVITPITELQMALQRGVVDGAYLELSADASFYEYVKYFVRDNGMNFMLTMLVNNDSVAELPPDLQDIFWDYGASHEQYAREYRIMNDLRAVVNRIEEYGCTVSAINPAFKVEVREKMSPLWYEWAGDDPAKSEALRLILEAHEAWVAEQK